MGNQDDPSLPDSLRPEKFRCNILEIPVFCRKSVSSVSHENIIADMMDSFMEEGYIVMLFAKLLQHLFALMVAVYHQDRAPEAVYLLHNLLDIIFHNSKIPGAYDIVCLTRFSLQAIQCFHVPVNV